ncbi:S8 family serine peptidase [Halalkalibacter akibai]|uniref:Protease n=1 Tax=Halalkalibacter akibai (strain ATCC 43226 / DSM 21942 / CIP 109018 / JCM 9157 / 1139) TaxID=1236973 RepID=W4QVT2_HALA3|nr:S8 family serine peptidase [Halalkalibacter akibai]GAE36216.1 protease [Halalkalibacter akibai JCM 9157]
MKKWLVGLSLTGLLAFGGAGALAAEKTDYIVTFSSQSIPQSLVTEMEGLGAEIIQTVPQIGVVSVSSANPEFKAWAESQSGIAAITEDVEIRSPETEYEFAYRLDEGLRVDTSGADLYEEYQWDIKRVTNNGASWEINAGNHDVVVAIIDSGVDTTHPDLQKNLIYAKSFVPGTAHNSFSGNHGTHVAGTIAANGRVMGVGPELGIASYRVSNWTSILAGITAAADDGVDVANLSLGTYSFMNDEQQRTLHLTAARAVRYAQSKDMFIVGANGNNAIDLGKKMHTVPGEGAQWPGPLHDTFSDIPWVVSVSSSTINDELAYYSNYGNVDLAGPGGDTEARTLSTVEGGYGYMIGTSMAAPKVAAAIGLVKAQNPDMKPAQIRALLQQTADGGKGQSRQHFGHGIVNVYTALQK